jgi:hypothetical protein
LDASAEDGPALFDTGGAKCFDFRARGDPVTMTRSPETARRARLRSRSACSTESTAARVSTVERPCTSTRGRRASPSSIHRSFFRETLRRAP